ncbi:HPr family phosphocarrier protein [Actinosynnema sp. ALI-1.44]|uniref:HPr family phosphocarrier protein n=1 Tax=Actinosynnema sp. ALI-1.44 TaxID=1933779 RepID=UPI00097C0F82|nr:HPr family phosphocarrier protein [Actinosynnema sp. ALI-1.44]ONI74669.1 HPr family phosphocarrier protein [Actinosynnema sp. ALI-1.44]
MATIRVKVASTVGLHARPAGLFAQAAARQPMPVLIGRPGGEGVVASSILAVMALGVKFEEEVELSAEGDGAEAALDELAALLAQDLDAAPTS